MDESIFPPGCRQNFLYCDGIEGELEYLSRLRSPEGKPLEYMRLGSVFVDDDCILDVYRLHYDGIKEPVEIYLNMYEGYMDDRVPPGFCFADEFQ